MKRIKTVFRGDITLTTVLPEVVRRRRFARRRTIERREVDRIAALPARLAGAFRGLSGMEMRGHLAGRDACFFTSPPLREAHGSPAKNQPSDEAVPFLCKEGSPAGADRIVEDAVWELAGFGELDFSFENCWRRDPLSDKVWGLEYHADVIAYEPGGADIRVLWELNRFGHALTLACAYDETGNEKYAETFFSHIEGWIEQNPYGRGANWHCAMEVALRAINLLAAFDVFRQSQAFTEGGAAMVLRLFDQHGRFILDNNEFSYIATSNHYLSNVVGLFWIGTCLPELEKAAEWRALGLSEMLREMDKQVLPDGADFEASTGYHKFVTEMLLYSFLLARRNGIEIGERYWTKLRQMLDYLTGIMRPDGRMPLIGDADGSQIVPIVKRDADDAGYLLAIAEAESSRLSLPLATVQQAKACTLTSAAFPHAGAYIMRDGDLYLHFNANDCGVNGRGSHAHNDALSIEVSAFGRAFIVDPGSYAYNLDRDARHRFRSTAYHSTVMVDGEEQNATERDTPFVMGNEAAPRVIKWETAADRDTVVAEHYGYKRLNEPVVHRRSVVFEKSARYWMIDDSFDGVGVHDYAAGFHFAHGLEVTVQFNGAVTACDRVSGDGLLVAALTTDDTPALRPAFVSRNYGEQRDSMMARWTIREAAPCAFRWLVVPVAADEDAADRLAVIRSEQ